MSLMTRTVNSEWVPATAGAMMLGISPRTLRSLANAGHIGVRCLPGHKPRYNAADIERLAESSVKPAHPPSHEMGTGQHSAA